jgi:hypothetical protein
MNRQGMKGKVIIESGKPLQFKGDADTGSQKGDEQRNAALIGDALKAYLHVADDLLKGK